MLMAMPDPNGTGQLYLQPLPAQLQIHKASGGMSNHPSNGIEPSNNMFLRQRSNAVSIRARRTREQENRSSFHNGLAVLSQLPPISSKSNGREIDNISTPNIGHSRRSRMQRFSSEFSTKEYDFSDIKANGNNSNLHIKQNKYEKDMLDKRSKSQGKEIDIHDGFGFANDKLNAANRLRTGQKVNREWRRQRAYSDEWDRPSPPKDMDIPVSKDESNFSRMKTERKSVNAITGYFRSNSTDGKHNVKDTKKLNSKKMLNSNTNNSAMETLDRRISASTDQLDTLTRRNNDNAMLDDAQKRFRRKSNCYSLDDPFEDYDFKARNKTRPQNRPSSGLDITRQSYSQQQKANLQLHPQRPRSATRFTGRSHFLSTLAANNRDQNNNSQPHDALDNSNYEDEYTFKYRGEKMSRSRYFFGNSGGKTVNTNAGRSSSSENNNNISNSSGNIFLRKLRNKDDKNSVNEGSDKVVKKTAVDIFLEDEGPYSRKLYGPVPPLPQEDVTSSSGGSSGGKTSGESSGSGGSAVTKKGSGVVSNEQSNYNKRKLRAKSQEIILESSDDPDIYGSSAEDPTLLLSSGIANDANIKKGLLWQQKDKIFSRWKERFFILTKDYFHCFKKGNTRLTEMGGFIFKLKLAEIDTVELLDKRGYLTVCVSLLKEGKIYLRRPEGIREWFNALQNNIYECKRKRQFWVKRQITDSANIEQWLLARQKVGSDFFASINELVGKRHNISLTNSQYQGMQYPYAPNSTNLDNSRNKLQSNNVEGPSRDSNTSSGDFNSKSGRPHDTGKSDDNISNGTFGMNNIHGNKQQQRIGSSNCVSVVQHHQSDYNTDIGNNNNINKASHPSQISVNNSKTTTLSNNQKKMLEIQDHQQNHSNILYEDHSKKLNYGPKSNQNGLVNNKSNNMVGGNKKSETHPYPNGNKINHRAVSQVDSSIPSKVAEQNMMNPSAHPPPPTGFTNPPLSSSSSNSSVACIPISDKNKPSMMQQYLLPKQRDTVLANLNTSLRPVTSPNSEATSQSTSVIVNSNSNTNNIASKGSGINRMSLVSELIMKEKLQKCSSSTGSETSDDVGISTLSSSRNTSPEKNVDGGISSHTNPPNHNSRYLPLNLKIDAPPSPSSSSSRVQPSTSSASSSSLSSDAPTAGKSSETGNEHRSSASNASGLPNNASSAIRRQRLDDSGNDSGHNSIMTSSDTQSDGTNSSGEEQRSPSKERSSPPSPPTLSKSEPSDAKDVNPNTNSANTNGSKTSLITITQASQPNKTTCQSSSVQSGCDSSQPIGASANSCNTKLSPIKMVQPIGFPTKLPPPPPQYQTASTTSTNLLKTNVLINKDQKPNPPISEKPSASNCISNMSRFKAQFQSARSLDSDIVLATASAIAASNSKDSVGANNTTEEMQEIPQQLPESAKLGSMVRQRESRISARKSMHRRTYAFGQVITEV